MTFSVPNGLIFCYYSMIPSQQRSGVSEEGYSGFSLLTTKGVIIEGMVKRFHPTIQSLTGGFIDLCEIKKLL